MLNRWLATLERRFGRYAIGNLTFPLVGAMGVFYVLIVTNPSLLHWLSLERELVLKGQLWRLITFVMIPPSLHPVWILFELWWVYTIGTMLEQTWGSFRYQMYWTLGWLGSVIVAMVWGLSTSNEYLLASVFLAFATVFPDFEVRLFFVIPVKVKWLGWLTALGLLALIGVSDQWSRLFPVVAVGNYLLFFWADLVDMLRGYVRRAGHAQQFRRFHSEGRQGDDRPVRACAVCGVTDADPSIDFRVCSCDKCKKPTTFCLEHARNH